MGKQKRSDNARERAQKKRSQKAQKVDERIKKIEKLDFDIDPKLIEINENTIKRSRWRR